MELLEANKSYCKQQQPLSQKRSWPSAEREGANAVVVQGLGGFGVGTSASCSNAYLAILKKTSDNTRCLLMV